MNQRSALMILVAAATGVAGALVGAGPGLADEQPADAVAVGNPMIGAVFAPDTDPEYAEDFLDALRSDPPRQQFQTHWNPASTALNNGGGARGDALELTWSILPDGTTMPAQDSGDTTCDSNLIANVRRALRRRRVAGGDSERVGRLDRVGGQRVHTCRVARCERHAHRRRCTRGRSAPGRRRPG